MAQPEELVVGGYNFKDWYTTLWFRPGALRWPRRCACCLSPATRRQTIAVPGPPLSYPICPGCERHSKIDSAALGISLIGTGALVIGGYVWAFGLRIPKILFGTLGLLVLFVVVALVGGAVYTCLSWFIPGRKKTCADSGWPVEIDEVKTEQSDFDKKSERTDEHDARLRTIALAEKAGPGGYGLHFRNAGYAQELLRENGAAALRLGEIVAQM